MPSPVGLFVARFAHLRRPEHDRGQLSEALLLLLNQELRVTDDVDEENMPYLEAKIVVRFRHRLFLLEAILCGDVFLTRGFLMKPPISGPLSPQTGYVHMNTYSEIGFTTHFRS
jgi:hypothetical protein